MLAAALAHVPISTCFPRQRCFLQCRSKSNLSAINRSLDQSIRRNRRKSLESPSRRPDDRSASFPRHDRSDKRPRLDRGSRRDNAYDSSRNKNVYDNARRSNDYDSRRNNDYDSRGKNSHDTQRKTESDSRGKNDYEIRITNNYESRGRSDYDKPQRNLDHGERDFGRRDYGNKPSYATRPDHGQLQERNPLKIPFTERHHFTKGNWDSLMAALQVAEDNYLQTLPSRPKNDIVWNKSEQSKLDVIKEIKKSLEAAFKEAEETDPILERHRKAWLKLALHTASALKTAKQKFFLIEGRPWFTPDDPNSAQRTVCYPLSSSDTDALGKHQSADLALMTPLNQDRKKYVLKAKRMRLEREIIDGIPVATDVNHTYDGALGFKSSTSPSADDDSKTKLSKSEKRKKEELDTNSERERRMAEKERKKLEEESWLDDDQLDMVVKNNREKNEDRKNKYKEIQEPKSRRGGRYDESSRRDGRDDNEDVYVSIPYTTAASEFIYGLNVVTAALKGRRRQLYKLYIHPNRIELDTSGHIKDLAKRAKVPYEIVDDLMLPVMDKMAQGRPHNGVILEASPLPTLPTKALGRVEAEATSIPIELAEQSEEDRAINKAPTSLPYHFHATWRKPLVLMLDGILDPGNVGNILRTAHFYGVDAVAICTNTCAPVNLATVQKAASGAAEALTLLAIPTPANFVTQCKKNGWHVHAAMAPASPSSSRTHQKQQLFTDRMTSPLARGPSILMIGAEGQGLRANLAVKAESDVAIRQIHVPVPETSVGVDSLNVASAVAVLLEAFMRKPDDAKWLGVDARRPGEEDVGARIV